jgi:hypothetical protein
MLGAGPAECTSRNFQRKNPQALPQTAWGFTPDSTLGSGDARNVEGIKIQRGSKRGLSVSGQEYGVVEGAFVSWNYLPGPAVACSVGSSRRRMRQNGIGGLYLTAIQACRESDTRFAWTTVFSAGRRWS